MEEGKRWSLLLRLGRLGVARLEVELVDHPEANDEEDGEGNEDEPVALNSHDDIPDERTSLEVGDGGGTSGHLVANANGELGEQGADRRESPPIQE